MHVLDAIAVFGALVLVNIAAVSVALLIDGMVRHHLASRRRRREVTPSVPMAWVRGPYRRKGRRR